MITHSVLLFTQTQQVCYPFHPFLNYIDHFVDVLSFEKLLNILEYFKTNFQFIKNNVKTLMLTALNTVLS